MIQTPAMRMVVEYGKKFLKSYNRANPEIRAAFKRRRQLFEEDPFHPLLRNHALGGKYAGLRSINITGDWRAIYYERDYSHGKAKRSLIIFEALGTHSELYK